MKLKQQSCSSTGLERHFERLTHHREARSRFRSKAFGPSRRFSAWLARTSRCAKLPQNRGHHPAYLLWGHRTVAVLPWPMQRLPKLACQIQLVEHQSHQPTPPLKLLRSPHMHTSPKQVLLEKAIAVLLGEASPILLSNLRQGDDLIEHDKPAHTRVPLGAFGRFPLDTDDGKLQITILLEMQVVPAADARASAGLILLAVDLLSLSMRFGTFALKERAIFGWGSSLVNAHRDAVELAVAFETDQHAVAQFMAGTQELSSRVPPICQDDHPSVSQQWPEGLQLRNGNFNGRLLTADALLVQNGGPTAGLLRDQHHRRKRPADADRSVNQRQIRQVDDGPICAGPSTGPGKIASVQSNPDRLILPTIGKQHAHPNRSYLLDIDASIFQRFIDAGPLTFKEGRQRQFRQRLCLAFTQQGITQVKQRISSSFKTFIKRLPNVLQYGKVHYVSVLCLVFFVAKNFTSLGSLWQARAAFCFPLGVIRE